MQGTCAGALTRLSQGCDNLVDMQGMNSIVRDFFERNQTSKKVPGTICYEVNNYTIQHVKVHCLLLHRTAIFSRLELCPYLNQSSISDCLGNHVIHI